VTINLDILELESLFHSNAELINGLRVLASDNPNLYKSLTSEAWSMFTENKHPLEGEIAIELFEKMKGIPPSTHELYEGFTKRVKKDLFKRFSDTYRLTDHICDDFLQRVQTDAPLIDMLETCLRVLESDPTKLEQVKTFIIERILRNHNYSPSFPYHKNYGDGGFQWTSSPFLFDFMVFDVLCRGEHFIQSFQEKVLLGRPDALWEDIWKNYTSPIDIAFHLAQYEPRMHPETKTVLSRGTHKSANAKEMFRTMILQAPPIQIEKIYYVANWGRSLEHFLGPEAEVQFTIDGLNQFDNCLDVIKELKDAWSGEENAVNESMQGLLSMKGGRHKVLSDQDTPLTPTQQECCDVLLNNPQGLTKNEIKEQTSVSRPGSSLNKLSDLNIVHEDEGVWRLTDSYLPRFGELFFEKFEGGTKIVEIIVENYSEETVLEDYLRILKQIIDSFELDEKDLEDFKKSAFENFVLNFGQLFTQIIDTEDKQNRQQQNLESLKSLIFADFTLVEGWWFASPDFVVKKMVEWTEYCIEDDVESKVAHISEDELQKNYREGKHKVDYFEYLKRSARLLID
jgi:hypothetical protein